MIAILGGGIAGVSLACALVRRGARNVVVFDPRSPGEGSTGRALGGFRTQHGSPLNIQLALESRPFFEKHSERIDFRPVGYLYIAEDESVAEELRRRAEVQAAAGLPIEHPEPRSLVPFLNASGVRGTNYCRLDGVYRPRLILEVLIEQGRAGGVDFRYRQAAGDRELQGAVVVVAAGVWSTAAAARLGVRLQVEPVERGTFQVGPFQWLTAGIPLTLEAGSGFHFRERDGRLLIMFPGDQADWPHVREWLAIRVPEAAVEQPEASWVCNYEVTFDHHALAGATEREGVWASCGFSGHGVMQSPAVADSLAAMMLGDTPPVDISALSPLRSQPLLDLTQL